MTIFPIAEFENQRTPFYFYDLGLLRRTLDEIKLHSYHEGYHVHYAIKANVNGVLLEEIRYNWRVEMWGEGFGMQTFRRFGKQVSLGSNHSRSNKTPDPNATNTMRQFTFEIPSGEQYYNPYLRSTTEMAVKQN